MRTEFVISLTQGDFAMHQRSRSDSERTICGMEVLCVWTREQAIEATKHMLWHDCLICNLESSDGYYRH